MKALFFDTETTGLPIDSNLAAAESPNNWPHPVSISWVVSEGSKIIRAKSYIIKPMGWTIPSDSVRIHGISQKMAETEGAELRTVLGEFIRDLHHVGIVVAHNLKFDKNVIIAAALYHCRDEVALKWPQYEFCTCESSRIVCKLPVAKPTANTPYKAPKLSELYIHCFKSPPPEYFLHTSLGDVLVLTACFFKLWTLEQVVSYVHEGSHNPGFLLGKGSHGDLPTVADV